MDDNPTRQTAETTLLSTMYPSEFHWRNSDTTSEPSFSLTLHPSYTLDITLPSTYPSTAKPSVYLSCGGDINTSRRKHARAALQTILDDQEAGVEILDLIVTAFLDYLSEVTEADDKKAGGEQKEDGGTHESAIKRVVIWSHHLLATSKRRDIQAWSKELGLGGFARPGHPGSVFVEGDEDQVDEFVTRLKQLRWQALQVRGEETSSTRVCGPGDGVVEVEGLGDIAERLKQMHPPSATLFLQAMKITKTE